jgi:5'-nucleotidase
MENQLMQKLKTELPMSINRRKFIKHTAIAGSALLASTLVTKEAHAEVANNRLTILHTNDVHSRLEPFPMDGGRNQGMGGVAARAALIASIRKETEHVLLLDAGDIFQGTPYFNMYQGEPEMKAMTMMGYDAATMGNHDFDGGIENFATQLQHANFPILICNYDFSNTPLENKTAPYKIFQKGKIKIGILGLGIELEGLVPQNLYGKTIYQDPILAANKTAAILKKQGCDLIICLSHLGDKYDDGKISDEILAKETENIDLILGGHTHRFFEIPRKYTNKKQNEVLVNQVGWAGIQLGRIDYDFSLYSAGKGVASKSISIRNK